MCSGCIIKQNEMLIMCADDDDDDDEIIAAEMPSKLGAITGC